MRRFICGAVLIVVATAVGCGNTNTPYSGPAITPLSGKNVPVAYGDPSKGGGPGKAPSKLPARK